MPLDKLGAAVNTPTVAAYIDLSTLPADQRVARLTLLSRPDNLGRIVCRAVVHGVPPTQSLPLGWGSAGDASAEQACAWAFDAAAEGGLPLLTVMAGAMPNSEAVSGLIDGLGVDPLFGWALPRLAGSDGRLRVSTAFRPDGTTAPLRLLASLPSLQIRSERIAPCMLFRAELVANLPFSSTEPVWVSLTDYSIRARRAGFRPVICNRLVVSIDESAGDSWGCEEMQVVTLRQRYAEAVRPSVACPSRAEQLISVAVERPDSLLVDARNLTPLFNGTSAAILGAGDALYRARPDDSVTIWLHSEAEACHAVGVRYPAWTICCNTPTGRYAASLRLSQPWHAADLDALSEMAAVNIYWMLDNIAWDIGYVAAPDLDDTWQRLASEADGLMFISQFSLQRFANRFTCSPQVRIDSCLLSLDPADYALPATPPTLPSSYWLVIGNRYDHKHVPVTVDILSRSFPLQNLVVFGDRDQPRAARVTRFASGEVDSPTIRGCYAHADVVIFPTFYEGFGLPIVEGLAYGRTVVARDSLLVRELAEAYRGPGRLIVYSSDRELLNVLGSIRRGEQPTEVSLNTRPGADVWGWDAVAARMLATVRELVAAAPSPQMLKRTGLSRGLG